VIILNYQLLDLRLKKLRPREVIKLKAISANHLDSRKSHFAHRLHKRSDACCTLQLMGLHYSQNSTPVIVRPRKLLYNLTFFVWFQSGNSPKVNKPTRVPGSGFRMPDRYSSHRRTYPYSDFVFTGDICCQLFIYRDSNRISQRISWRAVPVHRIGAPSFYPFVTQCKAANSPGLPRRFTRGDTLKVNHD